MKADRTHNPSDRRPLHVGIFLAAYEYLAIHKSQHREQSTMTTDTRQPWRRKRLSANERGYDSAWKRLRKLALSRDKHLCQDCRDKGRVTAAAQVDHVVPKAKGGTDALDNLRSLCRECHDEKSARDLGHRVRVRTGADGWPEA